MLECQNCGWIGKEADVKVGLADMEDVIELMIPGEIIPFGECPNCRAASVYHARGKRVMDNPDGDVLALVNAVTDTLADIEQVSNELRVIHNAVEHLHFGEQIRVLGANEGRLRAASLEVQFALGLIERSEIEDVKGG